MEVPTEQSLEPVSEVPRTKRGAFAVARSPFEGETTSHDLARLALARALALQQETRQAARRGLRDAAPLLARSAVDACITGLYCVSCEGAASEFAGAGGKGVKNLLKDLSAESLGEDFLASVVADHFGTDKAPNVFEMTSRITEAGGPLIATALYRSFYAPLSTFYGHASPLSLMRHVELRGNAVRWRGWSVFGRRSSVRIADASMGILAAAVAGDDHRHQTLLAQYGEANVLAARPPLARLAVGVLSLRLRPRHIVNVIRGTAQLRRAIRDGEPLDRAVVRKLTADVQAMFGSSGDDALGARSHGEGRAKGRI